MKKLINAMDVNECERLIFELYELKWWQFRRREIIKAKIDSLFVRPNQAK
mgnify:CR=1 FL=1